MILVGFTGLVMLFGFVLLFGAPYLPTLKKQAETALDLLDLDEGQTLYELGCGDGRVLRLAVKRGLKAVGYELNPLLVVIAWLRTLRYRKNVKVIWGNFWQADLSQADGVFVFLIERFMERLDEKMKQRGGKPIKLVSYAFKIPGKKAAAEKDGLYLYKY